MNQVEAKRSSFILPPSSFILLPSSFLTVSRLRILACSRLHFVVDRHGRSGPQFEYSRCGDFLAGFDAGEYGHEIAARGAELHELLAHAAEGLSVRTLHILDDEHRVAEGRVTDRRDRE